MGGRGSSSGATTTKFNGKIYKTIGNAKLTVAKTREGYGTSASKKRRNPLLSSLPEINKLPKGWSEVVGAVTAPAGYAIVSNNKSRFGGNREAALLKIEKLNNK